MGGTSRSTQQTQQSQQSQTDPWAPTQPLLKDILAGVSGQIGSYQPTSAETGALNTMRGNAANTPNFAPQTGALANDLLAGGPDRTSILSNAYSGLQGQLLPYLSPSYLDPTTNPALSSVLGTIKSDVGNSINGMFAGAGRDLSGMHAQTLARGLSQGLAAPLFDQYNRNVSTQLGAAGALFDAGGSTAGGLSALDQQSLANRATGLDIGVNGIPAAQNAGAMNTLNTEAIARSLPLQNLAQLLGLVAPVAGLGSQSSGTGTSTTSGTQTMSGAQQFATIMNGIGAGIGGFNPQTGAASGGMALLKMFSDRRTKDDIEQIGQLFDGTPIYRFRYKGDPRVTVGLMADDVERYAPEAVAELGGVKIVDYRQATERAARMKAAA